ncbi:MAG: AbrB/MazE/SpoVT family DNA-binding domain-containing protein [Patescibacteria group bacterium]
MLTQKLYKNGNSVAVTIPKEYLKELNLKEGALVELDRDAETQTIIISPKATSRVDSSVTPKFLNWLEGFASQYNDVLTKLAKE